MTDLDWAVAARARPPDTAMGDGALCRPLTDGWLTAVIDGLGHGPQAEHATSVAVAAIAQHASFDLAALIEICHRDLRETRGVVLALASFARDRTVTWVGVGNIAGMVLRTVDGRWRVVRRLTSIGGVVGYQLPRIRVESFTIETSEIVVLHTDGIAGEVSRVAVAPASRLAEVALERLARPEDDALIAVASYRAEAS
jgi:hypothetical protein